MRLRIGFVVLLIQLCIIQVAQGQGTPADYERSAKLSQQTRGKLLNATIAPIWSADGNSFVYISHGPNHAQAVWYVDATTGLRRIATKDEAAIADGHAVIRPLPKIHPSRNSNEPAELTVVNQLTQPVTLYWIDTSGDLKSYGVLSPGEQRTQSTFVGHVWLVKDSSGRQLGAYETPTAGGIIEMNKAAGTKPTTVKAESASAESMPANGESPDRRWSVSIVGGNVVLRNQASGASSKLTTDARAGVSYSEDSLVWSLDSSHFVILRTVDGDHRQVSIVQSSPSDQLQPRVVSFDYLKPGDRIPITKPHLFDAIKGCEVPLDDSLMKNPWDGSDCELRWDRDSRRFTFLYNQRGHQVFRVIAVDAASGVATAFVDEKSETFIDYAGKMYLHWLGDRELIWMSERDGWNHLYLYDATTGQVKNQITKGNWVVRKVDRVDDQRRQVWFEAGGIDAKQDPYYIHYCRVNLDGSGFVDLTPGDGTHKVQFSPDGRYYIDSFSRVDAVPRHELRRSVDGSLVCEFEKADASEVLATGWRYPERFTAKGRDGATNIYGIILRPSNFDPAKKYPVIEDIYAGPQDSFVPKGFILTSPAMAMAELGFIVVQIDGMGTSNRSKQFHDVCWRNLGDAGFPDRIAWIRAAAAIHPEMDLSHGVGIYGTSAGGQSALRAVEAHGEFYSVAVADCGCHDNRMDKIWWNELWMGWPVGPWYAEQSNVTNAKDLRGALLLIVGEMDHNVDPASTMQVVNALIKADKDFDLLVIPNADHGQDGTYGDRKRKDFFVRHLLNIEPPAHNK